jgi:hypothetical protein
MDEEDRNKFYRDIEAPVQGETRTTSRRGFTRSEELSEFRSAG